ncbi:MAG TPA: hypothetical protein VF244_01550 [Acidimicrobiales bacterium]
MPGATGTEVPYANAPRLVTPVSGLLAQLGTVTPASEEWIAGVTFRPEAIQGLDLRDICDTLALQPFAGQSGIIDTAVQPRLRTFRPFSLELREQCSTFGWREADYVERATRALDVRRHQGVEREFEQAKLVTTNPHLAQIATAGANFPTTTVNLAAGARVSSTDALALLDESIAEAGIGRGIIHASAFVITQWASRGLLRFETIEGDEGIGPRDQVYSPKGNLVIAGNGYQGADPSSGNPDATHASQWAYATDWIVVLATTPVTIPGTLDEAVARSRNLVVFRQEQVFAVLWAGLHHAVVKIATTTATVA